MKEDTTDIDRMLDSIHLNHPVRSRFAAWLFYYAAYRGCLGIFDQDSLMLGDGDGLREIQARLKDMSAVSKQNFIASHIDLIIAKLCSYNPVPEFFSMTDNYEDIRVSRLLNVLYQNFYVNESVTKEIQKFITWSVLVGTGYLKPYWNKFNDIPISLNRPTHLSGDIDIPCVSPFNVFPDPYTVTDNINFCQWVVHSYQIPMGMANNYFPGKKFMIDERETEYEGIIGRFLSPESLGKSYKFKEDVTRVTEYWEKGFPGKNVGGGKGRGLLKVRIGGQTVYTGANPNFDDDLDGTINPYPFIKFTTRTPVESFFGDGMVDRLVEAQGGINSAFGTMEKNLARLANARIILPGGCGLTEEDIENADVDVLKVEGDRDPHQMAVQSFDQGLVGHYNMCKEVLSDLSGLGPLSFGQVPQGGSQMNTTTSQSITDAETLKAGIMVKDLEVCIGALGLKFAHLAKKIPKETLQKYLSWSNVIDADKLKEADPLKGNYKISTQIKTGFGIGPQKRFEQLMMLYDRKLVPPDVVDRNIDFQYALPDYASYQRRAFEKADRDLRAILGGNPPDVSPYDPHDLMIMRAKEFLLGELYYKLGDEHKKAIHEWMGLHEQFIQQQQQQQAMLNSGNKGAGVPPQGREMTTPEQMSDALSSSPGAPSSNGG